MPGQLGATVLILSWYELKKLWNREKNMIESTEKEHLDSILTEATEYLRDPNKPPEDALSIIRKGLLSNPRSHHLYSLRGDICVKKGIWNRAIEWYEAARKMLQFDDKYSHSEAIQLLYHEKLKNSYRERGRWHEKNRRLIEAVADYEQASLFYPNIDEIYELQNSLLRCLRKLDKYEAYRVAWSEFMKGARPQRSADLMTQHAEFKIHIREVAAARRMLRKAVSLDEQNMEARDLLEVIVDTGHTMLAYAIIWCINGCYDKALITIDKGTDCDPYNPGFTVLKTIVLRLSGRLEEAFQWLDSVNRAFYKLLEPTHNKRGSIMGNLSVSQTRAMLIDQWYLIRYDMAVEHAINGRYEMALKVLRNEQILKKFAESRLLMGDSLQRQGKIDSALKAFLQAHEQSVATGCWQKSEKKNLIAQRIMEILNSRALSDVQKRQSRRASKTVDDSLKVVREEKVGITKLGSQRGEALMYVARSGYQTSPTISKSRDQCLRTLADSISFARGVDDGGLRGALLGDDPNLERVIGCFASEKKFPYHTKILLQN
ncbi:uncharacterized protein LOC105682948 isoform X1 [Athalia rosae]|uniref:uncharacterized protein LOC105682948 isoform X1 n=2 Tax=Athalia rosae TaxID=37344 RepID=UPI002033789E|nr:uncharacterized protein LOC105682948 isoform X1 [Athalia rosae]